MKALGKIKHLNEEITRALARSLNDISSYVRIYAVWALGELEHLNEEIYMDLARSLDDIDPLVKFIAQHVLEDIKPKSSKVLEIIKTYNPNLHQKILAN